MTGRDASSGVEGSKLPEDSEWDERTWPLYEVHLEFTPRAHESGATEHDECLEVAAPSRSIAKMWAEDEPDYEVDTVVSIVEIGEKTVRAKTEFTFGYELDDDATGWTVHHEWFDTVQEAAREARDMLPESAEHSLQSRRTTKNGI